MPIGNDIKITPTPDRPEGSETPLVSEGIYDAEIMDITYIPAEQNLAYGKPQLKLKFKIVSGEYDGVMLTSWVGMSMNPGGFVTEKGTGSPSHLYTIAKAVMGEEPDLQADFYPNVLMGGRLKIWVEIKTAQSGKQYSRVVKYSPSDRADTSVRSQVRVKPNMEEQVPLPEDPEEEEDIDVEKIPF